MRFLPIILLIISSTFSVAQTNRDSLINILFDGTKDTTIRMEMLDKLEQDDLKNENGIIDEKEFEVVKMDFEQKIKSIHSQNKKLLLLFCCVLSLAFFTFYFYMKNKRKQNQEKQEKLLQQIDLLKRQLAAQAVATSVNEKNIFSLDKEKIEKAINNKLGESSWIILNLIFANPSISNKEIAKEISLSVEGVSSSLRRMYQAFGIVTASNKKITLIMKATRLSFEN